MVWNGFCNEREYSKSICMRKNVSNKLNMFEAVSKTCSSHQTVWAGNPKFVESHDRFIEYLTEIRVTAKEVSKLRKRTYVSKNDYRLRFIDDLVLVKGSLKAHAKQIENKSLIEALRMTKSTLRTMTEEQFLAEAASLIELFQTHASDLSEFGITQSRIDDLTVSFDTFRLLHAQPRELEALRSAKLKHIDELLLLEMAVLKDEIDGMMLLIKESNHVFYDAYMVSRRIVNLKGGGKPKNDIFPSPGRDDDSIS